ncbi:hypothetical protein, partial [Clostridium thermarum]
QIHKKGFKCVRRYGLYSRKKNALAKEIIHLYKFVKQLKICKRQSFSTFNNLKNSIKISQ